MTPWQLQREILEASAAGDDQRRRELRRFYRGTESRSEGKLLSAAVAVCVQRRIGGPLDGHGDRAAVLARVRDLTAELRNAEGEFPRPHNFLETEGVIRSFLGETHHLEDIGPNQVRRTLRFLLRYLYATHEPIREGFAEVIAEARQIVLEDIVGPPDDED